VDASSPRWHRVTSSTFPWEDEAIDFLRNGLADADPNRAWSNFEFISGGVISEVDVLLLTRKGAFLIEIKSTPGRLVGNQQRWTFHRPDGGRTTMENPLLATNRKAKRLKSLFEARWRAVAGENASTHPPFIQPLVFLSDSSLQIELTADARVHVCGRDGSAVTTDGALQGIVHTVTNIGAAEAANSRFHQLNTPIATSVAKALDAIGIKESDHTRHVGSWVLRLDTVTERPGIQDFLADHERTPGVKRRVRIYSRQPMMSDEQADSLRRAADREFLATERLQHANVIRAFERIDTELGSAVVFAYERDALRLDNWLAAHLDIDLGDRLAVLRQLAETLQTVHRRNVTHRALSPGSVLVRPGRSGEARWVVLVTDFSLAGRDHPTSTNATASTTGVNTRFGLPTAAPGDVELLADESALLYQAPERFTEDEPDGVALDVFSFGAIAFHVIAGEAPGDSREAVRQALQAGRGLQLAARVPGVADGLHQLVLQSTRPLVSERLNSFEDVIAGLDLAEEELTAPTPVSIEPEPLGPSDVDPLDAKMGDRLGDDSVVTRRLGRGSTALALLVERPVGAPPTEVVYKVSLGGDADRRLADEYRILSGLDHPAVVRCYGVIELAGRQVLVEALAGRLSLSDELRRNGTPGIEFLHRWGYDLLDALRYLEREGRSHRDIKPENLGITEIGANREQHLVLFDFSLAAIPATDVRAGTPPYLEPFLADRRPPRWDLAAERYAAAVTLYEMATGETPKWGDGRSDPAFTAEEVVLDPVLFDPAARHPLEEFFREALRREPSHRFGNADEMLQSWQRVFEGLESEAETGPAGDEDAGIGSALPEALSIGDPIVSLGASPKVISALDRLGVSTVRQLADISPMQVNKARRISPRVRRRIIQLRAAVLTRFGEELAATGRTTAMPERAPTVVDKERESVASPSRLDLDLLVPALMPASGQRGKKGLAQSAVRMMLGLEPVPGADSVDWPSQATIADTLGLTRGRLGQIGPAVRRSWAELEALDSVRDDLIDFIAANDGVAAVRELVPLLIELRGSGLDPAPASIAARAVVRAAIEAEEYAGTEARSSRFAVRRHGDRVVVAVDDPESSLDGAALASYATALGDCADDIVEVAGDVVPQDRAVTMLRQLQSPEGVALADGRLLRLAAAASQHVGVSSALELYPVTLDPVRALRLTRQGLATALELTADDVVTRVRTRFPQVRLPERPELDKALTAAEVAVRWSDTSQKFVRIETAVGDLTTFTSLVRRDSTRIVTPSNRQSLPTAETDPAVAAAIELEGRLDRSLRSGGFVALRVPTTRRAELQRELARFTGDPHYMSTVDIEKWFLEELRALAADKRVAWEKLVTADRAAEGTTDHTNLRILTREAAARVEDRLAHAGQRVLAWNPGVLARYGELDIIDRLRDAAGRVDSGLRTLWLVVFGSTADARPTIDGEPVPVIGRSEWVDVTDSWLANAHRGRAATGTDSNFGTRTL
jgi:serine/threonine protein kinase